MFLNGVRKRRKGVGSIIAGAFLVLIILSGYEFYLLNNRTQNDYQKVLNEVRKSDIEKGQEDLKFTNIVPEFTDNVFELTIRNDGPELVQIRYAAIFKEGEAEAQYFELDQNPVSAYDAPNIMPSEVITIQLDDESTDIIDGTKYTLQIITDRGNVFPIQYPQDTEDYPYGYILSGAISKVIGRVLPIYDSFRWGKMPKDTSVVPLLYASWVVVDGIPAENFVFMVRVSHYNKTAIKLGSKTGLYFNAIKGPSDSVQCYIVYYDEDNNEILPYVGTPQELPGFDPLTPEEVPVPQKLFFSANSPGGDPLTESERFKANRLHVDSRYQVTLGIFDYKEIYAQSFPLIAIEVVNEL